MIEVKPLPAADGGPPAFFPPVSAESPLKVVWEVAGALDPATRMKDRGELAAPADVTRLFAQVDPGANKEIPVRLTVDGWPRAFQYQVKCDRDRQRIDRLRSLSQVQILAPRSGQAFRMPLASPIQVQFQADAPEDAFQEPGDLVEVGVEAPGAGPLGDEAKRQLFSDRQVELRWHETSPEGGVKIATTVTDFGLRLDPGGLKNMKVNIVARLRLAIRPDGPAAEGRVEVLLDGAAPVLDLITPATTVLRGQELKVSAKVLECLRRCGNDGFRLGPG